MEELKNQVLSNVALAFQDNASVTKKAQEAVKAAITMAFESASPSPVEVQGELSETPEFQNALSVAKNLAEVMETEQVYALGVTRGDTSYNFEVIEK